MKKMNKKILVATVAGIILVAGFSLFALNEPKSLTPKMNLSYDSSNSKLQSLLAMNEISMSNPLVITGSSIEKYCKFFSDENFQNSILRCTSTELTDSKGSFIGNVHMVGDNDVPFAVLGIMQTDPFMSEINSVNVVSEAMIESLVCDCWDEKQPGGFESVSEWLDAAKSHHLQAKKVTSKSEINGLAEKHVLIEISTNTEGYLWKLIITS